MWLRAKKRPSQTVGIDNLQRPHHLVNLKIKLTDLVCTYLSNDLNFKTSFYLRESSGGGVVFLGI